MSKAWSNKSHFVLRSAPFFGFPVSDQQVVTLSEHSVTMLVRIGLLVLGQYASCEPLLGFG